MRCPGCQDEYEPHVHRCATCGLDLVDNDAAVVAPPDKPPDARLGTFHPAVADVLLTLLSRRHVAHETVTRDDGVEVVVDRAWRDDLRTELTLTWGDILRGLPPEQAAEVAAQGGQAPGWLDPPQGGWVDREGRMIVDVAGDPDPDAARILGPALAVSGAVLLVLSWYAGLGGGLVVAGLALGVLGLLLPR